MPSAGGLNPGGLNPGGLNPGGLHRRPRRTGAALIPHGPEEHADLAIWGAHQTNERLGRIETRLEGVETQTRRTNRRLSNLEKRLGTVEVPGLAALEERVIHLEAAVFKPAAE
jgi:hypothetical protein